ncbi:MAG: F(420)H(2) dehydrogenase subunit M [Candidatus Heimdallarchaeota archaeon LC_3]|nr:MAG: F(420)H(2) dehydrogenase subunit M [Candidatus Heimdallarchaeota archaeon LC_3]
MQDVFSSIIFLVPEEWIVTLIFLLPTLGAIITFLIAKIASNKLAKWFTLLTTLFLFILSLIAFLQFEETTRVLTGGGMTYSLYQEIEWITQLNISYRVGVDGLSLPLVILSTFITLVAVIASWDREDRVGSYFALVLLLETGLIGTFVTLDMFFFFICWEIVLVPMFFLIGIWGGKRREYASIYFFIYTHVASLILLLGLLGIYLQTNTFSIVDSASIIQNLGSSGITVLLFIALFLGFIVKVPIVPFHSWLPLAHVEAPSPISMILAGLLLKMGGYGLIRFNLGFFPDVFKDFAVIIAVIGIISLFWGGFVALKQTDLKRLVAYSSIAHMGMVLFGAAATAATGRPEGLIGAQIMMLSHGIISPLLFNLSGVVQHSVGTREIESLRGITQKFPGYAALLVFASFASLGLPSLFGFISELYVFLGAFAWTDYFTIAGIGFPLLAFIAVFGVVVTVGFYLWMLQRVVWGEATTSVVNAHGIQKWEFVAPVLMLIPILVLGIFPQLVITPMQATFESFASLF